MASLGALGSSTALPLRPACLPLGAEGQLPAGRPPDYASGGGMCCRGRSNP